MDFLIFIYVFIYFFTVPGKKVRFQIISRYINQRVKKICLNKLIELLDLLDSYSEFDTCCLGRKKKKGFID